MANSFENAQNNPNTEKEREKIKLFKKKKWLRQGPIILIFVLIECIYMFIEVYCRSSLNTYSLYNNRRLFNIIIILLAISVVRYFVDRIMVNKKLQKNGWVEEEKEYYAASREESKKTAKERLKIVGVLVAIGLAIGIVAYVAGDTGSDDSGGYKKYNSPKYDNDYNFSDYLKDNDPDLYDDITDRYNNLTGK